MERLGWYVVGLDCFVDSVYSAVLEETDCFA